MTTVAASLKEGIMVADTAVSDGDVRSRMRKIERIGDALVGVAGSVHEIEKLLVWFRRGRRGFAPRTTEAYALVLTKDKLVYLHGKDEMPAYGDYYAIGTGGKAAMAAMYLGHDCETAVRAACEVDAGSCLPLQVERLVQSCEDSRAG